jgi:thiamine pyrophosphate-dependent acetolactate synthase large subunit-like protein
VKRLDRREVVRELLIERGELLVVAGLGAAAWDVTAAGDSPLDFPLWGAMGAAAMIGLGLALAQPSHPVLVITGDGEMLMGLSSLATIGVQRPANYSLVVLDNEQYGETGGQPTHTALGTDLPAVARACGFSNPRLVERMEGVVELRTAIHRRHGPLFASIKVAPDGAPKVLPPRDGAWLKNRMRAALLGAAAFE